MALGLLSSCWNLGHRPERPLKKVLGYRPVVSSDTALYAIRSDTARKVTQAGKIYVKGNLIFQNDIGTGVHVIDRSDPANLKNIGFLRIPGSQEISIKDNFLYTNSWSDLVVIDVSNWSNITVVKRVPNAFYAGGGNYVMLDPRIPVPERNVYYECYVVGTGVHTGWVKDSIYNNTCFNP